MGERAREDVTQVIEALGSPARPAESAAPPAVEPSIFGLSDVGKVRKHNEDSFLVAQLERSMRVYQSSRGVSEGANPPASTMRPGQPAGTSAPPPLTCVAAPSPQREGG